MAIKIGINGFGRIGRLMVRAGIKNPDIEFTAINDLFGPDTLAHLFKYDSTFGAYPGTVEAQGPAIVIDGKKIEITAEKEPANLPWKKLGVDVVIESTGKFTEAEKAKAHLAAGAKKVIISAPAKGEDLTMCMGINEDMYDPDKHHVLSNASCTTNCLAPLVKVLHQKWGVKSGLMTTIHSYTNDQVILDFPHKKDLRRARAAGQSMIPTSTGAAKAIGLVMPEMKGRMTGVAIRVPTPDVSLVDLAAILEKPAAKEEINAAFKEAASSGKLKGYLVYNDAPLVSKDFTGNPASCIFDSTMTDVSGSLVKVFGWYDNEWGYSMRLVDMTAFIAGKMKVAA
ncbi:MAG: type I glyceraldehyde-3-phosphate dehydrogenase [Elusimicrobia bacterium]|nr:type I glyceraldehyde-3-phosphate dehydrogenase [Elusimicrobiota bacterium]